MLIECSDYLYSYNCFEVYLKQDDRLISQRKTEFNPNNLKDTELLQSVILAE